MERPRVLGCHPGGGRPDRRAHRVLQRGGGTVVTRTQIDTYHLPPRLEGAWALLRSGDPRVRAVSGGTDLTIACPPEVTTLVDLSQAVPAQITVGDDGEIEIGAMATLTAMSQHPAVAAHATGVIPEMLFHVGSPLLRNVCTIGGHLVRGKLSDVVPVLIALDAEVTIHRGGDTRLTLAEYYGRGHHEQPHVLTAVHLPVLPPQTGSAFLRFARTAFDFPLANCCARISRADGSAVRIVIGAVPQRDQRAFEAEAIVASRGFDDA
ncbi:MAG: hypothetical protein EHM57_02235, partial [Actinobacteria bacterium]